MELDAVRLLVMVAVLAVQAVALTYVLRHLRSRDASGTVVAALQFTALAGWLVVIALHIAD